MTIELGLDTFGDIALDLKGQPLAAATVIREVLAEGQLADRLGVDFFGVGEHHRPDYAISAPDTVLAGLATTTERILLGTSVTVLSSDDPIRVFERFSTVDALSNGRAEITVGRGSFIESFPLFGLDLEDYEVLFSEKLDLLAEVLKEAPFSWTGTVRKPVQAGPVMPPTESGHLRTWVGVGGTPASVVRAAKYGLPVVIAIIGGTSAAFEPLADLYRRACAEFGHEGLPVGVHSPGHVAATDEQAAQEYLPHFLEQMRKLGSERGWPPMTEAAARQQFGPEGAVYCGSPETVARKVAATVQTLGASRFQFKYSNGRLPHEQRMSSIRLYAEEVAPRVRELLAQ
ncbi:LLM class flavin-dependent oxidoreductase [Ornithinimicrobium cryptoxanthini]|uniref:LLM class flavin-dependent oxidoreductase n=1 Tax=Ornithinimicrobium cryptoxanthini TaxID=2934161 RepID=A0ABY4YIB5_9MICO|nr:LLM class flavin-dependent oxidoreductase [Ornithinimicrobium cryptoxanthini]USQ76266.1 LLM class flavin-dependent oxidoreductase [Ornithinimicrobium cryptoxanthini]